MNRIYRSIWNAALGVWVAGPETARACGKPSSAPVWAATACGLALGLGAIPAYATCVGPGLSVICSGLANPLLPSYSNAVDNLDVTIKADASVGVLLGIGGTSMKLTGSGITVTNNGRIDPTELGSNLAILSGGLMVGNAVASTHTITNNGVIKGTVGSIQRQLPNLTGMAVEVHNGASGTTTITNHGTIGSSALPGIVIDKADIPVVAVYGGNKVTFTNSAGGEVYGRVAFQGSAQGNSFINAGTLTGSLAMGSGGGANTFTAVTGSTVGKGTGIDSALSVSSQSGLTFAATGVVDGGAGGNNRLILQNAVTGTGSGIAGSGTIDSDNYINFSNLTVNSGSWNLRGTVLTGTTNTLLNGGVLTFYSAEDMGSGLITGNGGTLQAGASNLTLTNAISIDASGLTVRGANDLTLTGATAGSGTLTKTGPGTLTLNNVANKHGDTVLGGGTLQLGAAAALGSGSVTVNGASSLRSSSGMSVGNNFLLNAGLSLTGSSALNLTGVLTGTGAVHKTGAGELTLSGLNDFSGGTTIDDGTLQASVANLGSGAITNNAALELNQTVDASLAQAISGSGSLTKTGAGALTLTGDSSSYTGSTLVANGGLLLASAGKLGGGVTVAGGATLAGEGQVTGAVTVHSGGTLAAISSSGTGSLGLGSLNMAQGSTLAVALGAPGADFQTPGQGGSVSVAGNLTLDGVALSVSDAGNFGPGLYRLFDYGGALTLNHGGLTTSLQGSTVQFLMGSKQINLINTQGMTLNFWNANGVASSSASGGGSGTWSNTAAVWTDATGSATAAMSPQPGFAIFGGASGTVTVDSAAAVKATGMQFSSDGYSLDGGALTLVADATHAGPVVIRVGDGTVSSSGWTATLNNEIAGSDGMKKTGAGTLVLNNTNTYSGGTTVEAGTLSVRQDVNLGAAGSDVTLDGGSLQITGTAFTGNGGRNWGLGNAGGGIDIAHAANRFTLASDLTGSGGLTKTGAGTLVLTGANTYSGGTTIDGGTLQASVANLGSGAITNNAVLELHQTVDASLTQDISGSGSFTKTGSGTLTLTGTNTSTGMTTISAGGLVASVANLGSGAITNNAALELNQASDATLAQAISGSGSLSKTGSGALTLTGDSSSYTGSTLVSNGSLLLASTGQLGGAVTVASGATLAGMGTVGSAGRTTTVQSGAVITTGDTSTAYGHLQVAGDLVLEQGSSYQVRVDPNSADSSRINVAGGATLAGSVLHVGNASNAATDFQVGKTYTILKASNILGRFDAATSNYAYLDAALGYTATDVTLQLQRKSNGGSTIGFADLAASSNQASVAHGIESLPSSHALYQHIETLPAGTPEAVLASLSGDTHASVAGSLVSLGARGPSISSQHLYNNLTAGMRSGAPVAQSSGTLPASAWPSSKALPAWAEVVGHWQTYNGDGNAARLKQNTAGLFVGMDQEVAGSGWRLGGSLGYTHADGRVADRSSTSKVDSYSAAVYGGKSFGTGVGPRINVLGGLAYTWHDIKTTRSVASLGQTLKADYSAHTAQLFAEVGYAIGQYDQFGFEPFVGVSLGEQRTRGFHEKGGFAALQGQSSTDNLASTTLGLRVRSDFQIAGKESRLRATVGWRHAFGDVSPQKTMAFEGGQNFTVAGAPLARNTALLGLEAEMALSRSAALVVGYRGELGGGMRDHAANVKVRWAF